MHEIEVKIEQLLGRSWSSYKELRGALHRVGVPEGYFDCFEEWKPGSVIIRKKPVGRADEGFSFSVQLQEQAAALAA